MKKPLLIELILLLMLTILTGCFQWNPKYLSIDTTPSSASSAVLLSKANKLANTADGPEKLNRAIKAYEDLLAIDPSNYEALTNISSLNLLMGDGYAGNVTEKIAYFRSAMNYSAQALYTNPDFKKQVDEGAELWEALDTLSVREMDAMFFWTTGVFYYYKEGLHPIAQVIDYRWVRRAKLVMERMKVLDAEWGGGGVYFMWGLYYLSIPESVGGDRILSAEYFDKAIAIGSNWLMNRWGRAKYFHFKMGNKEQFKKDLEWVLAQDIEECMDHFAWKSFFQKDADFMLAHMDEYF
jgi:tetratricopeptide (TPR) repeat protein